jgi:hypothetical protein
MFTLGFFEFLRIFKLMQVPDDKIFRGYNNFALAQYKNEDGRNNRFFSVYSAARRLLLKK